MASKKKVLSECINLTLPVTCSFLIRGSVPVVHSHDLSALSFFSVVPNRTVDLFRRLLFRSLPLAPRGAAKTVPLGYAPPSDQSAKTSRRTNLWSVRAVWDE